MINRRSFLTGGGAVAAACATRSKLLFAQGDGDGRILSRPDAMNVRFSESQSYVPDGGWRMWPDEAAQWKDDMIYLPDEVHLDSLPVNPPTGGWQALNESSGVDVTLPSTVEQFYWGAFGYHPYDQEYKFETSDSEVKNGAYYGVSWWWRTIQIPASFRGKRILLHIRGARQRAEVYLNQQLVGYSIMEELPFECDLTKAAQPGGQNELAIRITNPGGRLDWVDGNRLKWGGHEFQKSHGFGGLDRAMVLSAHDHIRISDLWVLNTPMEGRISANALIENRSDKDLHIEIVFSIVDPRLERTVLEQRTGISVASGKSQSANLEMTAHGIKTWDLHSPDLYRLRARMVSKEGAPSLRETDFGFRWVTTEGVGKRACIRLNGRRIRIYTSISWGYWALNGLFPTPELAEKEVVVAKKFNLNALNFHRNMGKEDVLYVQDRLGLLRCLEPGGGAQAFLQNKQGRDSSAQKYMVAKIKGMIRAFRSHPSVVHYIVQNETTLDPNSPEVAELFRIMQAEDPSRTIVGNDGFVMRSPQAWTEPYNAQIHRSNGKATETGGAGGWWVDHTGHFSDIWQDSYYNSPTDFFYRSTIEDEIVEWGEMKGAAAPDNHSGLLRQIVRHGGKSYDRQDHEEILRAYDSFLNRWGFRKAFPTSEQLFFSIGRRAYESWGQFMENVRICDENDMAAISGWESTAMENHSGLVDNFRDYKSDPKPLASSLLPVRPVAKQRHLVLPTGDRATFDLYLLNDSNGPVRGKLTFTLTNPDSSVTKLAAVAAPEFISDKLSYLLQPEVITPPLTRSGIWKTRFTLEDAPEGAHECILLVIDPTPAGMKRLRIGIAQVAPAVQEALALIPGIELEPFRSEERYDVIVASGGSLESSRNLDVDAEGAYKPLSGAIREERLPDDVVKAVRSGIPLLAVTPTDGQSIGVAKQLATEGAFKFSGMVGPSRASWMGSWYFVRKHPTYDGLPVDQAMSIHYQVKSGGSNGWLVDGKDVEIVVGYSRDHDRNIGAGTFTALLGSTPLIMHRTTDMHPVMLRRFLANSLSFLHNKVSSSAVSKHS